MSPRLGFFAAQSPTPFNRDAYAGVTYATVNDGPSIQTAINAVAGIATSVARQLVVIPAGTSYVITASLDAADYVDVIGDTENADDVIITSTANDDVLDNGGHNTLWGYMTLRHEGTSGNSAYAMHSDTAGANTEMTLVNVKFLAQNKSGVGIGIRGTQKLFFFGCEFIFDNVINAAYPAIFTHNWASQASPSLQVWVDCVAFNSGTNPGWSITEQDSTQVDEVYWFRGRIHSVAGTDINITHHVSGDTQFYFDSTAYDTITDPTGGRVHDTTGETITMPDWQPFSHWTRTPDEYVPPSVAYNPLDEPWALAYWAGDPLASGDPRTGELVDGDSVRRWRGDGETWILPLAGAGTYRPTASVLNNKPAWQFNGTTDNLFSGSGVSQAAPYTIVSVFYIPSTANQRIVTGAGTTQYYLFTNGASQWNFRFTTSQAVATTATIGAHLGVAKVISGNDTLQIDGNTIISGVDAGAQTTTRVSLGRLPGSSYSALHVAFVGIFAGDPTGEAWWGDFETWVTSEYGITIA